MLCCGDRSIRLPFPLRCLLALALPLAMVAPLAAQPSVDHDDVRCLSRSQFTQFLADVEPPGEVQAVKLYFRSRTFPEFYFVEMTPDEATGAYQAVLPLPSEDTTEVLYYIEALDRSFQTARSAEILLPVSGEPGCRPGPGGLFFPGDPGIVIGATRAGLPALPAGFQASGITGFISATGGAAAGGGIGSAVAIGAAAGAAAGVGVVVAGGGDADEAPAGGASATTSSPAGSDLSTTTTTAVTGAGSTSSSGTTSTTTVPPAPAPPSTTSTTSTGPTTSIPALVACIEWTARENCWVDFNSCSGPEPIQTYEWRMLGPPVPDPPQTKSFSFHFGADPRCGGTMEFNRPVRLTVYDFLGRSASVQQNVSVRPMTPSLRHRTADVPLRLTSRIVIFPPDGSTRGQLVVNETPLPPQDGASPRRHEIRLSSGGVRIEGAVLTTSSPGSLWELDFSSSESFVTGSLRVEAGTAVVVEERRVVFRLGGEAGERFLLRLEIR